MDLKYLSAAAFGLLLAGLSVWAAPSDDEAAPWLEVDTGGKSGVILELSQNGTPFSKVLILEGEKGSVSSADNEAAIGLVAEWIDLRGFRARLGVYRIDNQYDGTMPGGQDWLEDIELTRGGARIELQSSARAGEPPLAVRLVDTILASR